VNRESIKLIAEEMAKKPREKTEPDDPAPEAWRLVSAVGVRSAKRAGKHQLLTGFELCALGGIRTPNLLIRSGVLIVH
jgi:hypothetical protein